MAVMGLNNLQILLFITLFLLLLPQISAAQFEALGIPMPPKNLTNPQRKSFLIRRLFFVG